MSYYQLQRISNSDLSIAEHILSNTPYHKPEAAFRLGGAFHELLLEPEKFRTESCLDLDIRLLYRMYRTVISNQFCKGLLQDSEKEKVILWKEPSSGILCKCKLDLIVNTETDNPSVIDFKTTSTSSLSAFIQSCHEYNYDRQMAFYADSIGAKQVCLIGVSKKAKRLFFVQKFTNSQFIAEGRKKYQHLLQRVKELDLFETIYYERRNGSYSANSLMKEPPLSYNRSKALYPEL
ncbi:PD-(D/E)XK nuclease-like domain-containing protein [Catalinimonas niigatensis]|uniref:PD-(D/E)XK nuclease-like domain-containing protein n=1 Tax=Catalinimonas niigatensis TaxID=1397264 RepID=UPI002665CA4A|nr:PD-(D/E)XK nuclease-like domain-containing protein [Catalinimonas niigatensis]WPP51775.1 PD-(D/E)XK nuclease-like domain-containing protein [Catalinimonas niigatensis]